MLLHKETIKLRREYKLIGVLMGVGLFTLMRLLIAAEGGKHVGHLTSDRLLPVMGDLAGWPAIFRGFWPIDLLAAAFFGCLMWTMLGTFACMRSTPYGRELQLSLSVSPQPWLLRTFIGFGSFGGLIAAILAGWFSTVEVSIETGLVCTAGLLALVGLGRITRPIFAYVFSELIPSVLGYIWRAKPLNFIRSWLAGDTIPDDTLASGRKS